MRTEAALAQFMQDAVKKAGTSKADFAAALKVAPSALSRLLAGQVPEIRTLLRIALVTQTPPATVLRAAGLTEIADMLDDLFPVRRYLTPRAIDQLSRLERQIVDGCRTMRPEQVRLVAAIADAMGKRARRRRRATAHQPHAHAHQRTA